MDMSYFNYCQGLTMTSEKFHRLFGGPPREPESEVTQREMDLAASIQAVTEEIMLRMARHVHAADGIEEPGPGRRRRPQLRRQRPHPARRSVRATSGFSPRPAMRAERSARRCSSGINFWTSPERQSNSTAKKARSSAPSFPTPRSRARCASMGRYSRRSIRTTPFATKSPT